MIKHEGVLQKKARQLKAELRKGDFWYGAIMPLFSQAKAALYSAKTPAELAKALTFYFGAADTPDPKPGSESDVSSSKKTEKSL